MVAFSGALSAKGYRTDNSRQLIHDGGDANANCFMLNQDNFEILIDDGHLDAERLDYLISLRSLYLPMRRNGTFFIEPYNPHRFSRQFGFCQNVPGLLSRGPHRDTVTYYEALRYWTLILFSGSRSRVFLPACSIGWYKNVTQDFSEWWRAIGAADLRRNTEILVRSTYVDPEKKKGHQGNVEGVRIKPLPPKKATKKVEKPKFVDRSDDVESEIDPKHQRRDGSKNNSGLNPIKETGPSGKVSKNVYKRGAMDVTHEAQPLLKEGNGESDTNFKHNRHEKKARTEISSTNQDPYYDLFGDLPTSSNAPSRLVLEGEFDLQKEVPTLHDDALFRAIPLIHQRPGPGKGKELSKMKHLNIEPMSPQNKKGISSHSASGQSVSGPHSLEVAAKLIRGTQKASGAFIVSSSNIRNTRIPVRAENTIVPQTGVKGLLHDGLRRATLDLLKLVNDADFSDIEKIAMEAQLIYRTMISLKGNPERFQEKMNSYLATVKAFWFLEAASHGSHHPADLDRKLALEHERLEEKRTSLSSVDEECANLSKKIMDAQQLLSKLEGDLQSLQSSRDAIRDQISTQETRIEELEGSTRLSADDTAMLEQRRCQILELRASFDPSSWTDTWMDLVT